MKYHAMERYRVGSISGFPRMLREHLFHPYDGNPPMALNEIKDLSSLTCFLALIGQFGLKTIHMSIPESNRFCKELRSRLPTNPDNT